MIGIGLGITHVPPSVRGSGGGASLNLNFTSGMPGGVTVNSSPAGWAKTSAGVLTAFSANAGRRTDLGILIEPAATNIAGQSQSANVGWTQNHCTIGVDVTTGPDGSTTADKIQDDNTVNAHCIVQTPTTSSGQTYTYSHFLKASERSFAALYDGISSKGQYFDIGTGAVLGTLVGAPASARISAYTSGWFLCEVTFVAGATAQLNTFNSLTGAEFSYQGTTGQGLFVWNAQLELGSKASSPILTTGTAVTRTADNVSFTVPNGITNLTYTFDDNSTQLVSGVSAGTYTIPTNLNRSQIKSIVGS